MIADKTHCQWRDDDQLVCLARYREYPNPSLLLVGLPFAERQGRPSEAANQVDSRLTRSANARRTVAAGASSRRHGSGSPPNRERVPRQILEARRRSGVKPLTRRLQRSAATISSIAADKEGRGRHVPPSPAAGESVVSSRADLDAEARRERRRHIDAAFEQVGDIGKVPLPANRPDARARVPRLGDAACPDLRQSMRPSEQSG